mmetsp:Transcript_12524/g.40046  ORF Transcript_12524/g.40046 Transcript_12524/m.40046 type:complete len:219 (-) Transcript_12524:292-948(-)
MLARRGALCDIHPPPRRALQEGHPRIAPAGLRLADNVAHLHCRCSPRSHCPPPVRQALVGTVTRRRSQSWPWRRILRRGAGLSPRRLPQQPCPHVLQAWRPGALPGPIPHERHLGPGPPRQPPALAAARRDLALALCGGGDVQPSLLRALPVGGAALDMAAPGPAHAPPPASILRSRRPGHACRGALPRLTVQAPLRAHWRLCHQRGAAAEEAPHAAR